jgi:hypothetical protein
MCDEVCWRSARVKSPPCGAHRPWVERPQRLVRNEDLVRLCGLRQARSDVHVDAEVVSPNFARAPEVDTGAQPRMVTVNVHQCHTITRIERGLSRASCVAEDRHQTVAEPLHHLSPSCQDRRLDRLADFAEEPNGELVSGVQRPLGEAHEVGEQDRDINFASTSTLSLREPLPALKKRGPKLARDAGLLWPEGRQLTKRNVGGAAANAGQPVVDLLIAEGPLTCPPRRVQQPRVAVEPTGSGGEPPGAGGLPLAHGASLNQFACRHGIAEPGRLDQTRRCVCRLRRPPTVGRCLTCVVLGEQEDPAS